jgi:hypothetical protein
MERGSGGKVHNFLFHENEEDVGYIWHILNAIRMKV